MITHEEKKKFKSIVYSNIILSFLMLIIGLIFLIFPSFILKILPYALITGLVFKIIIQILCLYKSTDKIIKITFFSEIILTLSIIVLLFVFNNKQMDIIALLMGIYSLIETGEIIIEVFRKKTNIITYIINICLIVIHIIFAVSLFINLENSIKIHLTIYGLLFLVKGIFFVIKNIIKHDDFDNKL